MPSTTSLSSVREQHAELTVGLVLVMAGGAAVYEAAREDCLVGTEAERCTKGQGRIPFGVGLVVSFGAGAMLVTERIRR